VLGLHGLGPQTVPNTTSSTLSARTIWGLPWGAVTTTEVGSRFVFGSIGRTSSVFKPLALDAAAMLTVKSIASPQVGLPDWSMSTQTPSIRAVVIEVDWAAAGRAGISASKTTRRVFLEKRRSRSLMFVVSLRGPKKRDEG
jgi:hypothetical protein